MWPEEGRAWIYQDSDRLREIHLPVSVMDMENNFIDSENGETDKVASFYHVNIPAEGDFSGREIIEALFQSISRREVPRL